MSRQTTLPEQPVTEEVTLDLLNRKIELLILATDINTHAALREANGRLARYVETFGKVSAILETISDSSDEKAHTRGPLAREAIGLIREALK